MCRKKNRAPIVVPEKNVLDTKLIELRLKEGQLRSQCLSAERAVKDIADKYAETRSETEKERLKLEGERLATNFDMLLSAYRSAQKELTAVGVASQSVETKEALQSIQALSITPEQMEAAVKGYLDELNGAKVREQKIDGVLDLLDSARVCSDEEREKDVFARFHTSE